jgi:1-acyl-sn-glycerol-3-phosphate acyltransferase
MTSERGTLAAVAVAAGVGAATVAASILAIPAVLWSRDRGVPAVAGVWARLCLRIAGVSVRLEDRSGGLAPPYVVMVNHTSHFDVVALYAVLPIPVRFVAKRELQYVPIFGQVLALGAAIMIDRGHKARAIASIERAGRAIRRGASVVLFPEGTRTPPGRLGPLKKGPFHLAVEARVPVLPIGIIGTGAVLPRGSWRTRPGEVVVRLGAPLVVDAGPAASADEAERARSTLVARVSHALCAAAELVPEPLTERGHAQTPEDTS